MTTLIFILPFLVMYNVLAIYGERKIAAFMQDRLGPMETGRYGILQSVADLIKVIQKEDIVPIAADRWLFKFAPVLIFAAVFAGFVVIPLSPEWSGASLATGVFFMLSIISLDVLGIVAAGWSSNNKYSTLGMLRGAAQIISYEVPLTLAVLAVCMTCQSLNLQEISYQQGTLINQWPGGKHDQNFFLGIHELGLETTLTGGFISWNIFRMPLLFFAWVIFFIASLAECNRAPFDLPEAESEIVAGFQTEYSGFRWAVIMLAEYSMMLLLSVAGVVLFWGSWNTPLPNIGSVTLADWTTGPVWGIFWLISKTLLTVAAQMWVRWSFPRVRIDQLMTLSWKYLTPASLILICGIGLWKIYIA